MTSSRPAYSGLDHSLGETIDLIRDTVRHFSSQEIAPRAEEIDRTDEFPRDLWPRLGELGLLGITVSEEYGGAGLEMLDQALAAETLAYAGAPGPFLGHALAGLALVLGGSEEQKQRWLPRLAQGEALGTVALAEGDNVWQPEQWKLAGGSTLSGQKAYVPYADMAGVINAWVEEATVGRVTELVTPEEFAGLVALLVNTVYFKAEWTDPFDPAQTTTAEFRRADGSTVSVPLMGQLLDARVGGGEDFGEDFVVVELPYGAGAFSMMVVVPTGGATLADLVEGMDGARWQEVVDALGGEVRTEVRVSSRGFRYLNIA